MRELRTWSVVLLALLALPALPALSAGCGDDSQPCDLTCAQGCVDPMTDPQNCGGCGVQCPPGTTCEAGSCECPGTNELCEGRCVDVVTDRTNCGDCGVLCTFDSQCSLGVCGAYLEPYGTLDVDFSTAFVYDATGWNTDGVYRDDHWTEGVKEGPAATGTYGTGLTIPGANTHTTLSFALRYAGDPNYGDHLEIEQTSFEDAAWTLYSSPMALIIFPTDALEVQSYTVDLSDPAETQNPYIFLFNAITQLSRCVLAVASGGTLTVTAAENTSSPDGGSLTIQGSGIPLYHPTNTPYGDLTQDILAQGILVCQQE
ncbi:MAG: hypothetical protein ABI333_11380 [bacterium]